MSMDSDYVRFDFIDNRIKYPDWNHLGFSNCVRNHEYVKDLETFDSVKITDVETPCHLGCFKLGVF